jgi:glycosyltransferase involved in cell wall biosynthesis
MKKRLFYFAPVATDALNNRHGQHLHIGPADNKVFSVSRAIKAADCDVVIVSAILNHLTGTPRSEALRADGLPYVRLHSRGRGLLKRLISGISYAIFCLTTVTKNDRVVFYNFFPEFIPAALILRARGAPGILDVEDGPRADERGPRGFMVRTSYAIMSKLVAKRHLTVSNRLAKQLDLYPTLAIYGVAKGRSGSRATFNDKAINVLYGGAILPDTGLYLFMDAVRTLAGRQGVEDVHFHITGTYDFDLLSGLAQEVNAGSSGLRMTCHRGLSLGDYKAMLESIDVGLCLKLSDREMGQTTFPSKVVEYSSLGVLVLSTAVSDVPDLFDKSSAIILLKEEPESLADAIASIARDRESAKAIALCGRVVAEEKFSSQSVGRSIRDFVFA